MKILNLNLKNLLKKLWNKYAEKTVNELNDWAKKLKLYDPHNKVVEGITKEYEKAQKASDEAKIKFEKMEEEINNLASQIEKFKINVRFKKFK